MIAIDNAMPADHLYVRNCSTRNDKDPWTEHGCVDGETFTYRPPLRESRFPTALGARLLRRDSGNQAGLRVGQDIIGRGAVPGDRIIDGLQIRVGALRGKLRRAIGHRIGAKRLVVVPQKGVGRSHLFECTIAPATGGSRQLSCSAARPSPCSVFGSKAQEQFHGTQ
jgi:hypothetical protein